MRKFFRKSDSDAVIIVLLVVIAVIVLFPLVKQKVTGEGEVSQDKESNSFFSGKKDKQQYYAVPVREAELFDFDPNTADSTQLLRLGLRPWQVRNIYKYRAAGGRYRKPTDFARLYGLTLDEYKRLEPHIKIEREVMAADVYGGSQSDYGVKNGVSQSGGGNVAKDNALAAYPKKLKAGEYVNINTADTNQMKTIPGIGSYFARRIVSQRQRLGGIANVRQLLEIEDFPETSLAYMRTGLEAGSSSGRGLSGGSSSGRAVDGSHGSAGVSLLVKLRINHLDAKALSRHPYIRYIQAKEIMNFRRLRGDIKSAADLRRLPSFTDEEVTRLLPYIDFN